MALVACSARAWGQDPPRRIDPDRIRVAPTVSQPDAPVSLPGVAELEAIEISDALAAAVERLAAPSYATREAATAELLRGPFNNDEFYAVLMRRELTAEQRHRLLSVVWDRLLTTPRGAVGIKVDRRWLPDKVVIEELLPDLPAREVLEVGDRVTHLDGRPLEGWDVFVDTVQSSMPGATITITVERLVSGRRPGRRDIGDDAPKPQYEQIEIELELGSADQLLDPATGRPQTGGRVVIRRKREADLAMMRFGSVPKLVEIDER
jgi:hypothetical protein